MILLRKIQVGIAKHFPIRRSEWIMLLPCFGMWAALTLEPTTFAASASFVRLDAWGEEVWALILMLIGIIRLAALTVNGTFHQFRFSPHLRMLASLTGLVFWSQWTLALIDAYLTQGGLITGIIAYGTFCVLELANVYTSAGDIGDEVKRLTKGSDSATGL